jgi:hypothetical protein
MWAWIEKLFLLDKLGMDLGDRAWIFVPSVRKYKLLPLKVKQPIQEIALQLQHMCPWQLFTPTSTDYLCYVSVWTLQRLSECKGLQQGALWSVPRTIDVQMVGCFLSVRGVTIPSVKRRYLVLGNFFLARLINLQLQMAPWTRYLQIHFLHWLNGLFFCGDDWDILKEGVNAYQMAPKPPHNSTFHFICASIVYTAVTINSVPRQLRTSTVQRHINHNTASSATYLRQLSAGSIQPHDVLFVNYYWAPD